MQQTFLCSQCWTAVSYGQRACHNCGMILNWVQTAPSPHSQQNPNQQQTCEQQQLWNQPQLYNQYSPYNQPLAWGNQNQYWQQDVYGNPATKPKKQRASRFAVSLIVSMFIVFIAGAIAFATSGNIFGKTLGKQPTLSTSSSALTLPTQQIADAYKQALVSPLNKAGTEITDPNIASFYQKVVEGYALNRTSANSSNGEGSLGSLVPDLKKITETALNTFLKEAGKQINDSEIADFYNSFVQQIGIYK
jgi:hypothetical protein